MQLSKYEIKTQKLLVQCQEFTKKRDHRAIEPEHLLWVLLVNEPLKSILVEREIDTADLLASLEVELEKKPKHHNAPTYLSSALLKVTEQAENEAAAKIDQLVSPLHLLSACFNKKVEVSSLKPLLKKKSFKRLSQINKDDASDETFGPADSFLAKYTTNLTEAARSNMLDPVIGREKQLSRLVQVLVRRHKNNPVLVGEPGVGKSSIINGLAQQIVSGKVPSVLKNKSLLTLDIGSLLAGATLRGQFEERIKSLLRELKENEDRVLLFIDEIHSLVGAGGDGASDAANLLKPALARGEIQVLGSTTPAEYRNSIEKDSALERRFQEVRVEEPSEAEALEILNGIKHKYEEFHGVGIEKTALTAAIHFGVRYLSGRALPDKAIDLIDEAASKQHIALDLAFSNAKNKKSHIKKSINEESIAAVVSDMTGIPTQKMLESDKEKLVHMESRIKERVIGQEEAVLGVSNAIRRSRVGLADPLKPVGSFLFLGPTGVGKTELAKVLSDFLFDDERSIVRFDMSEFMEKHSVARLIGAPPGYQGADAGGQLTEAVRRKPYAVVLFDEIEKAHPDILNILLQILDDGRLSDSQGRLVDFNNSVIIMTSNIGSYHLLQASIDDGVIEESAKLFVRQEILSHFRPEFVNRIDEIVMFHGLTRKHIEQIAELQLKKLDILLAREKLKLKFTKEAKKTLIDAGFDVAFGARPLKRAIQKLVQDPLSLALLKGRFAAGDTIECTLTNKDGEEQLDFIKIK